MWNHIAFHLANEELSTLSKNTKTTCCHQVVHLGKWYSAKFIFHKQKRTKGFHTDWRHITWLFDCFHVSCVYRDIVYISLWISFLRYCSAVKTQPDKHNNLKVLSVVFVKMSVYCTILLHIQQRYRRLCILKKRKRSNGIISLAKLDK